jgi:hypothetical protein|tara:strand:- start:64 stop:258 length:195 start_codon:yes stop_codon:yes gene_type:complete
MDRIKVQNFKGLERDKKTGAILNTDKTAYDRYVREKNHRLIQKDELDSMKKEIEILKELLLKNK